MKMDLLKLRLMLFELEEMKLKHNSQGSTSKYLEDASSALTGAIVSME